MLKESSIVISEAKPKDVQALIGLWKRFMTEEWLAVPDGDLSELPKWESRLEMQVSHRHVFVASIVSGLAVGFAGFVDSAYHPRCPKGVAYIVDMYVTPEYRATQAALKLHACLLRQAATDGYCEVWANCSEENRRVQILLRHAGYTQFDEVPFPVEDRQVYFKMMLKNIR